MPVGEFSKHFVGSEKKSIDGDTLRLGPGGDWSVTSETLRSNTKIFLDNSTLTLTNVTLAVAELHVTGTSGSLVVQGSLIQTSVLDYSPGAVVRLEKSQVQAGQFAASGFLNVEHGRLLLENAKINAGEVHVVLDAPVRNVTIQGGTVEVQLLDPRVDLKELFFDVLQLRIKLHSWPQPVYDFPAKFRIEGLRGVVDYLSIWQDSPERTSVSLNVTTHDHQGNLTPLQIGSWAEIYGGAPGQVSLPTCRGYVSVCGDALGYVLMGNTFATECADSLDLAFMHGNAGTGHWLALNFSNYPLGPSPSVIINVTMRVHGESRSFLSGSFATLHGVSSMVLPVLEDVCLNHKLAAVDYYTYFLELDGNEYACGSFSAGATAVEPIFLPDRHQNATYEACGVAYRIPPTGFPIAH